MRRACFTLLVLASTFLAGAALAQPTRTPVFQAPSRAFARFESGVTASWVGFETAGVEGAARVARGRFDVGLRGGVLDRGDIPGSTTVLGLDARIGFLRHGTSSPVDAALILGAGTAEFDALFVPVGVSVGRRVDLAGASVVLYVQPTAALLQGADDVDGNRTVQFGLGAGADLRVGPALDVRASAGVFDYGRGLAISLLWGR